MKAMNKKVRAKAFYKVVGFFLVSFVIAIFLGFTTMNMGKLSDSKSKDELAKLKAQLKFQEETFAPNVNQASVMLAKLPTANETGENIEVLNQDIGALISSTKNQIEEGEGWEPQMYKDVMKTLSDLQLAYNQQLKLRDQLSSSEGSSEELQRCLTEKNMLQNQINALKTSGGGGGADCAACEKELKTARKKLKQCNLENRALKQEIEKVRNR